jgi:hypothetical protein
MSATANERAAKRTATSDAVANAAAACRRPDLANHADVINPMAVVTGDKPRTAK